MKSTAPRATTKVRGRTVSIILPFAPVPAARPQVIKTGHSYYPKRYSNWMKDAAHSLGQARDELPPADLTSAFAVALRFGIEPYRSVKRAWTKGDLDNYIKSVLDALTKFSQLDLKAGGDGYIWKDDMQVTMIDAIKVPTDEPNVSMTIMRLED